MSITFKELQAKLGQLNAKEWHQHPKGGGWVENISHVDATATIEGIVSGNAQVSGDAWKFSPLYIQGTRHNITVCSHTHIQIGCQCHAINQWQRNYQSIGKAQGYTPDQIAEYGMILAFCADWLKAKFPDKSSPARDAKGRFSPKAKP